MGIEPTGGNPYETNCKKPHETSSKTTPCR